MEAGVNGMNGMNQGREAEEEQVQRLRAVLHDLAGRKGRAETARGLGLDPRTVEACLDGGGMSWRVREALERAMQGDRGVEAARQRERIDALERRVGVLETDMARRARGAGAGDGAQGEEQESVDRQADAGPDGGGAAKPPAPESPQSSGPERIGQGRRRYPELVFMEPEHDDQEVYGDAWPLVQEWREIWRAGHRGTGRGLAWLRAEERVRTLEVAMLEEHGLTLPPEKMPLYGLDRRDQSVWRQDALRDARKALVWAELRGWLRRKLTFGRWRD